MNNRGEITVPIYASLRDISAQFGISVATLRRMMDRGEIESAKVGKARRILVSSVHAYFERCREAA